MSPVKIESGNRTFIAQNKERIVIRVPMTNFGMVCTGTEDGGRVVIARKVNDPSKTENGHSYNIEKPIEVHKGEEPVIKEYLRKKTNGVKERISIKISAI